MSRKNCSNWKNMGAVAGGRQSRQTWCYHPTQSKGLASLAERGFLGNTPSSPSTLSHLFPPCGCQPLSSWAEGSGGHSTGTRGLMWDENTVNLSHPSETGTCGFQKHQGTGSLKRGEGKREKVLKGWARWGMRGQDLPSTSPDFLRAGRGGHCLPTSVGQPLLDPGGRPSCPPGPLLPAHFLQHQQPISVFALSPWCSSCHLWPNAPLPLSGDVCEGREVTSS